MKEKEMGAELELAPKTEILETAKALANTNEGASKYEFQIQYDLNDKEFLSSVLNAMECAWEDVGSESDCIAVTLTKEQLRLVKTLDCVVRVRASTSERVAAILSTENFSLLTGEGKNGIMNTTEGSQSVGAK